MPSRDYAHNSRIPLFFFAAFRYLLMNKESPRLLSYIIPWDSGKAPNPWWEDCTLAVCKPVIRRTANEGDWIVGLTPKSLGHRLVYAMQIREILTFAEYYKDPRYSVKKPDFQSEDARMWMGDNFYEPVNGEYIQHISAHNVQGRTKAELKAKHERDISGKNVLISDLFFYYGGNHQPLHSDLDFLRVRRGHKVHGVKELLAFERKASHLLKNPGVHGIPLIFESELAKLAYLHKKSS